MPAWGDTIELATHMETHTCVIDQTVLVRPDDGLGAGSAHTRPSTTLVTCYPFHLSIYWAVPLAIHRPPIPANSDPSEIYMSTKMEDCEGS
jgi:hypothetical protein